MTWNLFTFHIFFVLIFCLTLSIFHRTSRQTPRTSNNHSNKLNAFLGINYKRPVWYLCFLFVLPLSHSSLSTLAIFAHRIYILFNIPCIGFNYYLLNICKLKKCIKANGMYGRKLLQILGVSKTKIKSLSLQ